MIQFKRSFQSNIIFDPSKDLEALERKVETRWDPLTGYTSRILHIPQRKFQRINVEEIISTSLISQCPFCPENIESMTCKFQVDRMGFERFKKGEITVIPNLLPFDRHCVVAILSENHFLDMEDLIKGNYLFEGITAILEVIRRIKRVDPEAKFFSINCNYMPMSGSSILHPHIQAIAGEYPTNYHGLIIERSTEFFTKNGKVFWDVILEEEERLGERYIGKKGKSKWYVPFAPKGTIDVGGVFEKNSFFDLHEEDVKEIEEGLKEILSFFNRNDIGSFNFSIYSGLEGKKDFKVNLRIIARRFIPPVNASDSNYFDKLHGEYVSYILPEEVAKELREVWQSY